jgi:hypothetical protein
MNYRGDDLDLRTPDPAPGEFAATQSTDPFVVAHRARSATAHRGAPIWVDETVLDACNHAFDVASAHRAAEVQLEHLIYALTRIEDAALVLEQRGLRIPTLRRDAATYVATDIPAVAGNGKSTPHRSDSFEEVLRLAAARAYRRQEPVGVADLVYALFDSGVEFRGVAHLVPGGLPRPLAPPPAETREPEIIREARPRATSRSQRANATDLAAHTATPGQSQTTRIDSIEQSVRTLTTELAKERQILSGVLQDLQRELMAQREDTSRFGSYAQDKAQSAFGERLQHLEQAFLTARNPAFASDTGPLQDRLAHLERALQSEIAVTRSAVETLASRPALDLGPLLDRLEVIEVAASQDREAAETNAQRIWTELAELSAALGRQPGEISTLVSPPLVEKLGLLSANGEAHHAAASDSLAEAHRRLAALEEVLGAFVEKSENAAATAARERASLREEVTRLTEVITQESAAGQESFSRFSDTLTQDLSEVHDGLAKITNNQHTLATTFDVQAIDAANAFQALNARIESLERAAEKPVEMLASLSATVEKMHKVTVEKYYRRNRFWYWLFGTDDWLAASWPSQSARIAEELRAIKR